MCVSDTCESGAEWRGTALLASVEGPSTRTYLWKVVSNAVQRRRDGRIVMVENSANVVVIMLAEGAWNAQAIYLEIIT